MAGGWAIVTGAAEVVQVIPRGWVRVKACGIVMVGGGRTQKWTEW